MLTHVDNDPMLPGITVSLSIALPVKNGSTNAPMRCEFDHHGVLVFRTSTRREGPDDQLPAWIGKNTRGDTRAATYTSPNGGETVVALLLLRKERHGRLSRRIASCKQLRARWFFSR